MAAPTPVVIEAAINGATPKSRNPHVPTTPDEIARDALACMAAGAAIVHNHIDDFALHRARGRRALPRGRGGRSSRARPDAILYCTVGVGGVGRGSLRARPAARRLGSRCAWACSTRAR